MQFGILWWLRFLSGSYFCTNPKQFYSELLRRGFQEAELQEMRQLAWLTAGWLNYEKMMWEWTMLDESDIKIAIEWQHKDGIIDDQTAAEWLEYVDEKANKAGNASPDFPVQDGIK